MPDKKTIIKEEVGQLLRDYATLEKLHKSLKKRGDFGADYQIWYTKALRVVQQLAPDRIDEFVSYYRIDPKRKSLNPQNYVLQDYVMGVQPKISPFDITEESWNTVEVTRMKLLNQYQILHSLFSRIDGSLANLESTLYSELQDAELTTAIKLKQTNLRAAGALAGVVLEAHLQKIAVIHKVKITKTEPTISELNDPLKNATVYDTPTWRKIQYLADIRNLCSHKKAVEPTPAQVGELINGVNEIIKTIF